MGIKETTALCQYELNTYTIKCTFAHSCCDIPLSNLHSAEFWIF